MGSHRNPLRIHPSTILASQKLWQISTLSPRRNSKAPEYADMSKGLDDGRFVRARTDRRCRPGQSSRRCGGGVDRGLTDSKQVRGAIVALQKAGAGIVLLAQGETRDAMLAIHGEKTRVPAHLRGVAAAEPVMNLLALSPAAAAWLDAVSTGEQITLPVHADASSEARMTYSAIGYLPGSDTKAGTLLLTAHLDHMGVGRPVNGDAIWNGANDDASGTTTVLELAHALASGPRLRRSVLFVCYGSEELGGLGSTYFGEHPPVPLTDLVANLQFEMVGNQDPKMPRAVLFLTGWDRSDLGPTLKGHGALLGPDPYPDQHFFQRSDNYPLALKGVSRIRPRVPRHRPPTQ